MLMEEETGAILITTFPLVRLVDVLRFTTLALRLSLACSTYTLSHSPSLFLIQTLSFIGVLSYDV